MASLKRTAMLTRGKFCNHQFLCAYDQNPAKKKKSKSATPNNPRDDGEERGLLLTSVTMVRGAGLGDLLKIPASPPVFS